MMIRPRCVMSCHVHPIHLRRSAHLDDTTTFRGGGLKRNLYLAGLVYHISEDIILAILSYSREERRLSGGPPPACTFISVI